MDNVKGCIKLVSAIFLRAIDDALGMGTIMDLESANHFLDRNNKSFQVYSFLLGFDPDFLERKILNHIKMEKIKRRMSMRHMNKNLDGAPYFDMDNNQNPEPHAPIFYGKTPVPKPCNEAAKKVDGSKIMREVRDAK